LVVAAGGDEWSVNRHRHKLAALVTAAKLTWLPFPDTLRLDTVERMEDAARAIGAARAASPPQPVLVTCKHALSRAPALVMAHLIRNAGCNLHEAFAQVSAGYAPLQLSHDMFHALVLAEKAWHPSPSWTLPPSPVAGEATATSAERHAAEAALLPHAYAALPAPTLAPTHGREGREARAALFHHQSMDWQDATLILPDVWISNVTSARDVFWLRHYGVKVVLNCAVEVREADASLKLRSGVEAWHSTSIVESSDFDAVPPLLRGADVIRDAVAAGKPVLVHCLVGMNRSVSTVVTWLVRDRGLSLVDALAFVRTKRRIAFPNGEMWSNLIRIEGMFKGGRHSITTKQVQALHPELSWSTRRFGATTPDPAVEAVDEEEGEGVGVGGAVGGAGAVA